MLNATYRLLVTAQQMVTAEGEWWHHLPEEMKKQYIQEHPHSKYAQGYKPAQDKPSAPVRKGEQPPAKPKAPVNQVKKPVQPVKGPEPAKKPAQPSGQQPVQPPAKGPSGQSKRPLAPSKPTGLGRGQGMVKQFKPKDEETAEAVKKLPAKAQSFLKNGGTEKGSKARKESGQKVKSQSRGLARGILHDTVGIAKGLNSTRNMLNGKPQPGDLQKAASLVGTILGTSAMVGLLGASGPVGFLAFMAVKHLAAPQLYKIAQKALQKKPPGDNKPGYGYWKDKNTWVPLTKKEFDALTDEEVNDYQKSGKDKSGKFNKFEKRDSGDEKDHGYWEDGKWHSLGSTAIATEDEDMMKALIDSISDYVENGDISDEAWAKAVQESAGEEEER